MHLPKQRLLVILVSLVVLSLVWEYLPEANSGDQLKLIQQSAEKLDAVSIPLDAEEIATLGGARAVKFRYHFDSKDWVLIAVDGSGNSGVIHDPSYCFHGTGWKCVEQQRLPLENGNAEILTFTLDKENMTFAFWFDDGRNSFSSMLQYWLHRTARRITLGASGNIPIMLSLYPQGEAPTPDQWKKAAQILIPKLLPASSQ